MSIKSCKKRVESKAVVAAQSQSQGRLKRRLKQLGLRPPLLLAPLLMVTLSFAQDASVAKGFRDRTTELGLQLANSQACWVDLDRDGWADLCAGGAVWRNDAGRGFSKLAEGLGEVVAADFDNDGLVDLFSWSSLQVFRNQGGKEFTVIPLPALPKCVSRGACCGDFDGDGFVDLYVGGYEDWDAGITYPNFLLLNEQGKSFRLAWSDGRYRSRGVTACDFDQDGDLDVYVSNYRLQPNVLWRNDGKGHLLDLTAKHNAVGTSPGFDGGHSIGAAWGDFDNNGTFDLFVGNFAHVDQRGDQPKSRFLSNPGTEAGFVFADRGPCGVFYQESYASPSAGDFDNDGDLDLFFTTVYETASFGRKNNPVLFQNEGDFEFRDATMTANLGSLPATYQAAWADFDHDGDLDLVTAGKLFENQSMNDSRNDSRNRHWVEVRLEGDGKTMNRSAIGAQVRIPLSGRTITRQVEAGTGEGNQNDLVLHFGLGDQSSPIRLEILWPNGTKQTVENIELDRLITVTYAKP
jgi:hypothetical protein